ncbi:MAG: DUF1028 domain-containing protein [Calditrichae bacterium]|nr:DUF1028 domain-containing protein [Calditrichota bacterium]MCB9059842.1 DUF1028 domain-containing protein [Calditrichia bacterium]
MKKKIKNDGAYMKIWKFYLLILSVGFLQAQEYNRPVHTYSIVAYDSASGQMGVAVQSHWFQVGTVVTWAEAGVGVVATQSFVDVDYGKLGLDLMRGGKTAPQALQALLTTDPHADVRQVAMIDVHGNVASHTGEHCIAEAGHFKGDHFSTQANIMEKKSVWPAMAEAYQKSGGELVDRLMAALKAAQAEGGDIRGKQSAAILIVPVKSNGQPWKEKIVDLRVDDNPEPLREMERLIMIHRAYEHMNKGDEYLAHDNVEAALKEYSIAHEIYPEQVEILFWTAATMADIGKIDESLPLFKEVFEKEPSWREVLKRLPRAGLLPNDASLIKRILQVSN